MNKKNNTPLLSPIMRWFIFSMVLANISGGLPYFLMSLYMVDLGASVGQVGIAFTLVSVVILPLQILGGWLSDSIGRLRTVAIGSLFGIVGLIGIWLAPTWEWLLVALIVDEITVVAIRPSFAAFIAENSTEETRGRVFGITEAIYTIVGVVVPPLAGFLAFNYGFKLMLAVATLGYALAAVLRVWLATTQRFGSTPPAHKPTLQSLISNLRLIWVALLGGGILTWIFVTDGISDIAFRISDEFVPLYYAQVGGMHLQQIGYLGAVFGFAMMLTAIPGGWLADKYGERFSIMIGFALQSVSYVVLISSANFTGFAYSRILFGLGAGITAPAFNSLVSKAVSKNMRGMAYGLFFTSTGIISLFAPFVGAQMWERISPQTPMLFTALALGVAILPVWLKFKLPKKKEIRN